MNLIWSNRVGLRSFWSHSVHSSVPFSPNHLAVFKVLGFALNFSTHFRCSWLTSAFTECQRESINISAIQFERKWNLAKSEQSWYRWVGSGRAATGAGSFRSQCISVSLFMKIAFIPLWLWSSVVVVLMSSPLLKLPSFASYLIFSHSSAYTIKGLNESQYGQYIVVNVGREWLDLEEQPLDSPKRDNNNNKKRQQT